MAFLGSAFAPNWNFYTLTNACVLINITDGNIKYTGKYWKTSISKEDDNTNPTDVNTLELYNRILERICNDNDLAKKINEEIGIKITNKISDNCLFTSAKLEYDQSLVNENNIGPIEIYFARRLFQSTLGLEEYYKQELALLFSGIQGHSWDMLLRFFTFSNKTDIEKELANVRRQYPTFEFIRHNGTPLASYVFDFKGGVQSGLLGGYNALNFSHVLNSKIINIRDKLTNQTTYTPPNIPNCIIPIVFNNALLQCKTHCYRSYKNLLGFMKTRQQRDYLFDHLTHYGRRCMTILDPYGIFMHFHNDQKGLVPSWREFDLRQQIPPKKPIEREIKTNELKPGNIGNDEEPKEMEIDEKQIEEIINTGSLKDEGSQTESIISNMPKIKPKTFTFTVKKSDSGEIPAWKNALSRLADTTNYNIKKIDNPKKEKELPIEQRINLRNNQKIDNMFKKKDESSISSDSKSTKRKGAKEKAQELLEDAADFQRRKNNETEYNSTEYPNSNSTNYFDNFKDKFYKAGNRFYEAGVNRLIQQGANYIVDGAIGYLANQIARRRFGNPEQR